MSPRYRREFSNSFTEQRLRSQQETDAQRWLERRPGVMQVYYKIDAHTYAYICGRGKGCVGLRTKNDGACGVYKCIQDSPHCRAGTPHALDPSPVLGTIFQNCGAPSHACPVRRLCDVLLNRSHVMSWAHDLALKCTHSCSLPSHERHCVFRRMVLLCRVSCQCACVRSARRTICQSRSYCARLSCTRKSQILR